MGKRGEVFTTRLFIDEGRKTFFFNVKENRLMDRYIITPALRLRRGHPY